MEYKRVIIRATYRGPTAIKDYRQAVRAAEQLGGSVYSVKAWGTWGPSAASAFVASVAGAHVEVGTRSVTVISEGLFQGMKLFIPAIKQMIEEPTSLEVFYIFEGEVATEDDAASDGGAS